MTIKGKIIGVSLGPGDPDLITVKGLTALKEADKIYFPGSLFANERKTSYSLSILEHFNLDNSKLIGFYLEMNLARTQAKEIYETTYQQIKQDYENGLQVVIVSEGDINTYSSFSYLLEKIKKEAFHFELIPGITSYVMAASEHAEPLSLQNEKVLILPRVQSEKELREALANFHTVVLMKIISVIDIIDTVLSSGDYSISYSERLGTANQFVSKRWGEVKTREIPYFSLIIIKK